MVTLSFTGLLTLLTGITLVLLVVVIIRKQPLNTTDTFDKVMLSLSIGCLAASLMATGGLVMAGAVAGIAIQELTVEAILVNSLKIGAIIFGWVKIIRNVYILPFKKPATQQDRIEEGVGRLTERLDQEKQDRDEARSHRGLE